MSENTLKVEGDKVMINMYENYTVMGYIKKLENAVNETGRNLTRFFLVNHNTNGKELFTKEISCIMFDSFATKREKDLRNGDLVMVVGVIRANKNAQLGFSVKVDYIKHLDPIYKAVTNGK